MRTTLVAGLCTVAVISGLTIFMVRVFVRKYLFDHFRQIQTGIYDVLEGKRNLAEEDSEIPELKPLAEMIFRLEREYMEKAEGLTRMEGELSAAKNEADYDRLTGLYNRNGFESKGQRTICRAAGRRGRFYCLIWMILKRSMTGKDTRREIRC